MENQRLLGMQNENQSELNHLLIHKTCAFTVSLGRFMDKGLQTLSGSKYIINAYTHLFFLVVRSFEKDTAIFSTFSEFPSRDTGQRPWILKTR